jgi:DNA modification methylase
MTYEEFLRTKKTGFAGCGFEPQNINPELFEYQAAVVRWALMKGRAALFEDCGLGKTIQQLEWARQASEYTSMPVMILAPLAVSQQTVREGAKFGYQVTLCETQADVKPGINITNYQKLDRFNATVFSGVVLDESSILKNFTGSTRTAIIEAFSRTDFRLACTATPAPNDHMELGNHAEFLGVMTRVEMLSMYFCHDGGDTAQWRIKGHAKKDFWAWVCSWAVMVRKPSDIGFEDTGFDLPPLNYVEHLVKGNAENAGMLFGLDAATLEERRASRRFSIDSRVAKAKELADGNDDQWLIWCDLNDESDAISAAIPDSVAVAGSDTDEHKSISMEKFAAGEIRVLVTKPKICGFGMNFQSCHNIAFVGLSDSYEAMYQSVRRCYRFGQKHAVNVHIITSEGDGATLHNIKRKDKDATDMARAMIENMGDFNGLDIRKTERKMNDYKTNEVTGDGWTMYHGDCVEMTKRIADDSIGYSIFSPPFASLYTYSNSDRDMGNCKNSEEFMKHFRFLIDELYRVTMPGRNLSFHCMLLPTSKVRDGVIGLHDFRGDLIRAFQDSGWVFHSEVVIWKDPVTAMQRTKALGLLHKQLKKDSCMSRQGIPDYLVTMRKPGVNPVPVSNTNESFPVGEWQEYASPVWMDINPSETLQGRSAREHDDERHICPLQLEVIRRGLRLWSRPGDRVLSPFAGIGSEGYEAIKAGREFVGIELKQSYFEQACANLRIAANDAKDACLFTACAAK